MMCNQASASNSAPTVITSIDAQMSLAIAIEQIAQRIPFDANELCNIPLNDEPWRFCYVLADDFQSDWHQIRSALGIYVGGSSSGIHRVAVNSSYLPWLFSNGFTLRYTDPEVDNEESVQGKCAAAWNADFRYVEDAVSAISSGCPQGLELTYRNHALMEQQLPIEWAILWRDLGGSDTQSWRKFCEGLVFFVLGCCDDYNTPAVLALLRKNEAHLFQDLEELYRHLSSLIINHGLGDAQIAFEFHRLSIFRHWFEFYGMKRDDRQQPIDLRYTANSNANILSSIVGIEVFKPFGGFDMRKMHDALAMSALFSGPTVHALDVLEMSTQMRTCLPIGFPDGYLYIPTEVHTRLDSEQAKMLNAQIAHSYHELPSLQMPRNNILMVLCWSSITPTAGQALSGWVASRDSWTLYQRLIEDIQQYQPTEQLVLTLGALLCYRRLSPRQGNDNQYIKCSGLADFDTILSFKYPGNALTVLERMALSLLRILWPVKDSGRAQTFLSTLLDIQPPEWDLSNQISDQYWRYRVENELDHRSAFKMVEKKFVVTPVRHGREEMAILNDGKEQEPGVTTTDDSWVLVEAQLNGSVISPSVSDYNPPVPTFPSGVFHLEAYKAVYVCLPNVPPHNKILTTIKLLDGCSMLIVFGLHVSQVERDLRTCCIPYNFQPGPEVVGSLGLVEAHNQQVDALANMAINAWQRDTSPEKQFWISANPCDVFELLRTWLGGVAVQSEGNALAHPQSTGITSNPGSGRIQLDGYNFHLYTLVGVSKCGQYALNIERLWNFDAVLSVVELEDQTWEVLVCKSFLKMLKNTLSSTVPGCKLNLNYSPFEPSTEERGKFGYETARIVKSMRFHERAELMMLWPKAAAFYSDLTRGCVQQRVAAPQ